MILIWIGGLIVLLLLIFFVVKFGSKSHFDDKLSKEDETKQDLQGLYNDEISKEGYEAKDVDVRYAKLAKVEVVNLKKFNIPLSKIFSILVMFGVATIAISIGSDVISEVQNTTTNAYVDNISTNTLAGLEGLSQSMPDLAVVMAAAIVIGVLTFSFVKGVSD